MKVNIHADSRTIAIVRQNVCEVLHIEVWTDVKNSGAVVRFRPPVSRGLQPHRPFLVSEQL